MSLQVIGCTQCHRSGVFDIKLSFEYQRSTCGSCHHHETKFKIYYFCTVDCMFRWLREEMIEEHGFPCPSCVDFMGESTGFLFGFEGNGICKTCNGSKRLKAKTGV